MLTTVPGVGYRNSVLFCPLYLVPGCYLVLYCTSSSTRVLHPCAYSFILLRCSSSTHNIMIVAVPGTRYKTMYYRKLCRMERKSIKLSKKISNFHYEVLCTLLQRHFYCCIIAGGSGKDIFLLFSCNDYALFLGFGCTVRGPRGP